MTIYIIFMIYILLIKNIEYKSRVLYLLLTLVPLFIIIGFRGYSVGIDTLSYCVNYGNIAFFNLDNYKRILFSGNRYEIGYVFLIKILYHISENPRILFIVTSLLLIIALGIFLYRYSPDISLSILLFISLGFFANSMNAMRQYIAWSLLLLAFVFLVERKPFLFTFFVIFASLFHLTALVFIILYPLLYLNFNFRYFLIFTIFLMICLFNFDYIIGVIFAKITSYSVYEESILNNGTNGYLNILLNFLICALVLLIYNRFFRKDNDRKVNAIKWTLTLACLIWLVSFKFAQISRIANYFTISLMIAIPLIVKKLNDSKARRIYLFLLIMSSFVYFIVIQIMKPEWNGIVPYVFTFNN